AAGLPIGNVPQRRPNLPLKLCSPKGQGQIKLFPLSREIFLQLPGGFLQQSCKALLPLQGTPPKIQPCQGAVFLCQRQVPHRRPHHHKPLHTRSSCSVCFTFFRLRTLPSGQEGAFSFQTKYSKSGKICKAGLSHCGKDHTAL